MVAEVATFIFDKHMKSKGVASRDLLQFISAIKRQVGKPGVYIHTYGGSELREARATLKACSCMVFFGRDGRF